MSTSAQFGFPQTISTSSGYEPPLFWNASGDHIKSIIFSVCYVVEITLILA